VFAINVLTRDQQELPARGQEGRRQADHEPLLYFRGAYGSFEARSTR
jgi:hypothetical protein